MKIRPFTSIAILIILLAATKARPQEATHTEGLLIYQYSDGDIPTDYYGTPSSCPGIMEVTIPEGHVIIGLDVEYEMTAGGGAWMIEQRSRIYSPTTGTGEPTYAQGSGNSGGTYHYVRSGLNFANGATGTVVFHMDASRTWSDSGCNTTYNKVDNNSWVLVVYIEPLDDHSPPTPVPLSLLAFIIPLGLIVLVSLRRYFRLSRKASL